MYPKKVPSSHQFRTTTMNLPVRVSRHQPTGMAFDAAGNLFVASNEHPNFAIIKFATDGSHSTFADNTLLSAPHRIAFDAQGNLFVANSAGNTIVKFTPDGVDSIFADADDGLLTPIAVAFDTVGNL